MKKSQATAVAAVLLASAIGQHISVVAFPPSLNVGIKKSVFQTSFAKSYLGSRCVDHHTLHMVLDPSAILESGTTLMDSMGAVSSSFLGEMNSNLLAFSDQGQNLAGIFFQASLLPYVIFLYFLGFRGNRVPTLSIFGFQFLLLFVLSTIPSGIITKSTYGCSLANVDWLHGAAEALLTVTNLLIVLGFRGASTQPEPPSPDKPRVIALGLFAAFIVVLAGGISLGVEAHSPFLFGLGDLPADLTNSLPWVSSNCVNILIFQIEHRES